MWSHLTPRGVARCLLLCLAAAGSASAEEAARIVFVSGAVQSGTHQLAVGDAVQEGDEISTGAQGYVYLKTVDNGLLILRPASRARIVTYHVDRAQPANTRIKFELLSGVARSVSGDAVKLARQNFRFNTPVAAIGVRGTDFTVSTDQEVSRVTVISGAIVVSGFTGSCLSGGSGPCEHNASRELAASQVGQMLQVKRGQAVPQLLSTGMQAPDMVAPPRNDEPLGKSGGSVSSTDISLDPRKADNLLHQAEQVKNNVLPPVLPPVDPVVVEPAAPVEQSKLVWGRWQAVLDQAPQNNNAALAAAGDTEIARNSYYTIFRTKGEVFKSPEQGSVGFTLKQSEAIVTNSVTNVPTLGTLENGVLAVDFGKARFSTSFDLLNEGTRSKLVALGMVTADGQLYGDLTINKPTNMLVKGGLSAENGGSAAYIFTSRLDDRRVVNGVTYWGK